MKWCGERYSAPSGPSTCPTLETVKPSVFADATSSAGTSRGSIACRVGALIAKTAADALRFY